MQLCRASLPYRPPSGTKPSQGIRSPALKQSTSMIARAQGGGGGKSTPMDKEAAARIQSAGAKNPDSPTAKNDFDRAAQSAADKNANKAADDQAAGGKTKAK